MTGEGIHFCDQKKCLELRRAAVRNNKNFECSHVKKVLQSIEDDQITPLLGILFVKLCNWLFFYLCRMSSYNSEAVQGKLAVLPANAKKDVLDYIESVSDFVVKKITDWSYLVKWVFTPFDWCVQVSKYYH